MRISIAKDFSDVPAGRYPTDGEFSGERFREEFLKTGLEKANQSNPLIVDINDVEGYGSSFLEEAFGGLVRESGFQENQLKNIMKIEANAVYDIYRTIIWDHIHEAKPKD